MPYFIPNSSELEKYLTIGSRFSAVFIFENGEEYSGQCSFTGMKKDQYLIFEITARTLESLITYKADISSSSSGIQVIIRGFADTESGHIIAFRTQLLGIRSAFSWLMFVEFPERVEAKVVRKDKRLKINLQTEAAFGKTAAIVVVRDISVSGCCLYVEQDIELHQGDEVKVKLQFDNLSEPLQLCTIANWRKNGAGYSVGMTFNRPIALSDQLRLELLQYSPLNL
ncbi:hypothetical protein DI392_07215 [Vibrio albus]|jgi:hypothetical protein|uniref:PilZ domain-containing protein n=1 Tax=Vibrio albus TaxID=2200953 RepID=A0A2U3BB16_9VIBR|nr:PilZ domain-containing protein [Vibrio albus]PWI33981.1 hypothetical protein DI392_07215 [Vibrio albus]